MQLLKTRSIPQLEQFLLACHSHMVPAIVWPDHSSLQVRWCDLSRPGQPGLRHVSDTNVSQPVRLPQSELQKFVIEEKEKTDCHSQAHVPEAAGGALRGLQE